MIEAAYKAFARALREAVAIDPTETGVPVDQGDPHVVIGIVDHGLGNRRNVLKALEKVGADAVVSADHDVLRAAEGLVVPGVGAFAAGMQGLRDGGLDELVVERARAGTPVIGLCVGMQLLFDSSTELGGDTGLGPAGGRGRCRSRRTRRR